MPGKAFEYNFKPNLLSILESKSFNSSLKLILLETEILSKDFVFIFLEYSPKAPKIAIFLLHSLIKLLYFSFKSAA